MEDTKVKYAEPDMTVIRLEAANDVVTLSNVEAGSGGSSEAGSVINPGTGGSEWGGIG